jgi:hypothetical protein
MDPVRRVWTIRHTTTDMDEACERATELRQAGLRVFVRPHQRAPLTVKPLEGTESWRHRYQVAGQMSDRADANKKYKSMG